jgi:hypothetical protein
VTDRRRETYFINGPLVAADMEARQIEALQPDASKAARQNVNVEGLMKHLADHSRKTEKLRTTQEGAHEMRSADAPRARVAELRGKDWSRQAGRQP